VDIEGVPALGRANLGGHLLQPVGHP
jgi:hypothetical protein